jgi:hypothetical protein
VKALNYRHLVRIQCDNYNRQPRAFPPNNCSGVVFERRRVLIINGARDPVVPPVNAEYLHERLPKSTLETLTRDTSSEKTPLTPTRRWSRAGGLVATPKPGPAPIGSLPAEQWADKGLGSNPYFGLVNSFDPKRKSSWMDSVKERQYNCFVAFSEGIGGHGRGAHPTSSRSHYGC